MDLLFNELSIHKQFNSLGEFEASITTLMEMRKLANNRFGKEIYHNGELGNRYPIPSMIMQQAIGNLSRDKASSFLIWIGKYKTWGSEIKRSHGGKDYLECCEEIVTDTSVGEVGFRNIHGENCSLVSLLPSDWCNSPLKVTYEDQDHVNINNYWCKEKLETALVGQEPPIRSWSQLFTVSKRRFKALIFAQDSFKPLDGIPFSQTCANSFVKLLDILNRLVKEQDNFGTRTKEGHKLYNDYFTGGKGKGKILFSDSSESEKRDFKQKMTFPHPYYPHEFLFCPYHGKISHQTMRLHFSWPIKAGKIYIVYAGPKITMR